MAQRFVKINSFRERLAAGPIAVKICGITDRAQALAIVELGADFLGFNFWPRSPRYLGDVSDHPWVRDLAARRVGVFVDADPGAILDLWKGGWIDAAQLHGRESPETCRLLENAGLPVIKAIGIEGPDTLGRAAAFQTAALLLDTHAPAERGGTGRTFDWELARRAIEASPGVRIILAGGLNAQNVRAAIAAVRPAAVDVASGVESAPGRKDLEKVRRFIEEARAA